MHQANVQPNLHNLPMLLYRASTPAHLPPNLHEFVPLRVPNGKHPQMVRPLPLADGNPEKKETNRDKMTWPEQSNMCTSLQTFAIMTEAIEAIG